MCCRGCLALKKGLTYESKTNTTSKSGDGMMNEIICFIVYVVSQSRVAMHCMVIAFIVRGGDHLVLIKESICFSVFI